MWDLIGLGADILKAGVQASEINTVFSVFREKYPDDFPIFESLYSLFGYHSLKQYLVKEEAAPPDQMILLTPTRGAAEMPFRCVARVDANEKLVSIRYRLEQEIAEQQTGAMVHFINQINTGSSLGYLTIYQDGEENTSPLPWQVIYQITLDYKDASRPPRIMLENMLKSVFFAADAYAPALVELAHGITLDNVMAKVRKKWMQVNTAPSADRKILIDRLEAAFREVELHYTEAPENHGFLLDNPNWASQQWRYLMWVSPSNRVVFEIHFTPNIPEKYMDTTLFYGHMLRPEIILNTHKRIAFIKRSLDARGCERELETKLLHNLIDRCVTSANLRLRGLNYVLEGLEAPVAFKRGVEDSFKELTHGPLPPEMKQIVRGMVEFMSGYTYEEEDEPNPVEEQSKEADTTQAGKEELENGVSMKIPDLIPPPGIDYKGPDGEQRRAFRAFLAADTLRSRQESDLEQHKQAARNAIKRESEGRLASAVSAVEKIAKLNREASQKIMLVPGLPALPQNIAIDTAVSGAPWDELVSLEKLATQASSELVKNIADLERYREHKRIEMIIRFVGTLVVTFASIAIVLLPFILGFIGAVRINGTLRSQLVDWGATTPWVITWIPLISVGLLFGLAALVTFMAIGVLSSWKAGFTVWVHPLYERLAAPVQYRLGRRPMIQTIEADKNEASLLDTGEDSPIRLSAIPSDEEPIVVDGEYRELFNPADVQKPENIETLQVQYCTNCGRKLAPKDAVCPNPRCKTPRYKL